MNDVNYDVTTVYLPLTPVQKLFRNHVIETAPALPQDVIASIIDSNILNPQVRRLKKPEQSTICSGQEGGVGESYLEKWVGDPCSEIGVDDAYLERGVGDYCSERLSEIGVGDSYSEGRLLELEDGNSYSERRLLETDVVTYSEGDLSEIQVGDSYSESGLSDTYTDIGVEDSQTESKFNCHSPVRSYSVMTRSRSTCVLNSMTRMTRSRTRKMKESRSPSCRCDSCRETKQMLGKEDGKVHKDSSSSFPLSEVVSRRRRSGSSSREIPHRRTRSRSRSLNRNSRGHHYSQNTFNPAETGVCSYSECDSSSERALSDTCSVMGLSDTYSEIRDGYSKGEGQYDCHLPVTSYSQIVTYSRSRCVLNSNTHPTRSLTKKMLEKKECNIHEDSNSSCSLGEGVRGRQSGSSNRRIPRRRRRRGRRRRSRSLSVSRNTRKHHSNQNTFSPTEPSYSECDSNSEIGLSDTCSVMGLSDTYSDIGVEDSQTESQFNCHSPVRSYSVVTRSRSRCILNTTTVVTRSLSKKMKKGSFPSCRCETCKETKEMLGKEEAKVHKNSKVNLNSSVSRGEAGRRRRCGSVDSCGGMQYRRRRRRRSRRRNWGRSTIMHHSIQNSDGSVAFMNRLRASMQVRNGSRIKQVYVTEEIGYLNNGVYDLNVIGNSQSGVVCNSDIGVREVTEIDYSNSNVPQHHNSENMKKPICCINMGTGVEGAALCGLNGVSKRKEAVRVHESFSVPHSKRQRVEELEGSYGLHATEMESGSLTE